MGGGAGAGDLSGMWPVTVGDPTLSIDDGSMVFDGSNDVVSATMSACDGGTGYAFSSVGATGPTVASSDDWAFGTEDFEISF